MRAGLPGLATFAAVALVAMLLDLATKALALRLPPEGLTLLPVLNLHLGFNSGVSFGLFAGEGNSPWIVLLTGLALMALVVMGLRTECPAERAGCASSYDLLYHIEMQAFFLSDSRGGAGIGDRHLVRYCDGHERSSARAVNSFDARRSIQSLPAQASISPIRWSIWSRPRAGSG